MVEKTQKAMLQELSQAVIGIPDSPDNGIIGDIKEIKIMVRKQNDRVRKNERHIAKIWGVIIGCGALGGTGIGLSLKALLENIK